MRKVNNFIEKKSQKLGENVFKSYFINCELFTWILKNSV